jgi:DNA-directed RNA polymerase specialized sigma24 family protein
MTIEEFGEHFAARRPYFIKWGCKRGLTPHEAEDVVQNAAKDLLLKCSRYPNVKALSAAFAKAIDFGVKRAGRSWSQRRKLHTELRARQGLTGTQTPVAEAEPNSSDRDRVVYGYGYGQLTADQRGAEDAQINALEHDQMINRAPASMRPILQRSTEGASFTDVAKELGISKEALRQRLSRYRRANFLNGCHKPAVSNDLYSAESSPSMTGLERRSEAMIRQ